MDGYTTGRGAQLPTPCPLPVPTFLSYIHDSPTHPSFTELAGHLAREGFPPELYATPYFLTLFAHNLELYLVHRLWVGGGCGCGCGWVGVV